MALSERTHAHTYIGHTYVHIHSETNQINKTHVTSNMSHIPAFCSLLYCIPALTQARSVLREWVLSISLTFVSSVCDNVDIM